MYVEIELKKKEKKRKFDFESLVLRKFRKITAISHPCSWHEAQIVILFKKEDPKDIKSYRPINLLSHSYKIFTRLLQTRTERTLDENQPREQAGFRKGYSTTDHLQALNQIIEKSNEYNLPLCIDFIDYEKAFDTVERFTTFETLRKTNVNETYINILQNIYNQATARVYLDKLVSTEFPIHRSQTRRSTFT